MTTMNTTTNMSAQPFDAEQFERETGWSWSDAVDEAATIQREKRVFRTRRPRRQESLAQRFELLTGCTYGAALDLAAELRRERRIFGRVGCLERRQVDVTS